jgi:hypothetical protein
VSDKLLDLGSNQGNPPISQKQSTISLEQFANRMGQATSIEFNNWMNKWVAGYFGKK